MLRHSGMHMHVYMPSAGHRLMHLVYDQAEGYVARSAFKLLELQKKFRVIPLGACGSYNGVHMIAGRTCCCLLLIDELGGPYARKRHAGSCVLDLGCCPGSWLQVACQSIGPSQRGGRVVGLDIQDCQLPERHIDAGRVHLLHADVQTVCAATLRTLLPK
jgi:23S rRNA U2552 (ribose-2'-O)-methylase RlmE/FtsJ